MIYNYLSLTSTLVYTIRLVMSQQNTLLFTTKRKRTRIRWSSLVALFGNAISRITTKYHSGQNSFTNTKNIFVNRRLRSSLFEGRGGGGGHGNPDWVGWHFGNAKSWNTNQINYNKNSIFI